jgi:hypothetical protein
VNTAEGIATNTAKLAAGDKEGAQSMSMGTDEYHQTTLHRSCRLWRENVSNCSKQHHQHPRQQDSAKQATTHRKDLEQLRSFQSGGPLGHSMFTSKGKLTKLICMDIKQIFDRQIVQNKKGTLTNGEIQLLVKEIHDRQQEGELQQNTVDMEMKSLQRKIH